MFHTVFVHHKKQKKMREKVPIVADGLLPTPSGIKVIVVGAGQSHQCIT